MTVWNKLSTGIKQYLKKPKKRYIYAVTKGDYLGEFFVYMDERESSYVFMSLPDFRIRKVPVNDFDNGVEQGVLDMVERLPRSVYIECQEQYTKTLNNPGTDEIIPKTTTG